MRWCRYSTGGKTAFGIIEDGQIWEVEGSPFGDYRRSDKKHALESVALDIPVIPGTFYCCGQNYGAHIREMAKRIGMDPKLPQRPEIGYRANSALIAHERPVILPADATEVHYEGELVVVIGRQARNVSEADALKHVLGYTIGNDVSERAWQRSDRTIWRSKNSDTFKPMGPWIETDVDLDALETIVRVNGAVTSRFATNSMLFGVATFISAITRYITLQPGDVIWMGTDGESPDLKSGDLVEVEITGIGVLRNRFESESAKEPAPN